MDVNLSSAMIRVVAKALGRVPNVHLELIQEPFGPEDFVDGMEAKQLFEDLVWNMDHPDQKVPQ